MSISRPRRHRAPVLAALAALALLLALPAAAQTGSKALAGAKAGASAPASATLGDQTLWLPIEAGYHRLSERLPPAFDLLQAAVPPANRVVEAFHTEPNLGRLAAGGTVEGHYYVVQTMRSIETANISVEEWQANRAALKQGMVSPEVSDALRRDEAARDERIRQVIGDDVAMRIGELQAPHIYAETPASTRFLMRVPLTISTGEGAGREQRTLDLAAAGAIVHVRGKLLFLYCYAVPGTPALATEARAKLDAFVEGVLAANGGLPSVETGR